MRTKDIESRLKDLESLVEFQRRLLDSFSCQMDANSHAIDYIYFTYVLRDGVSVTREIR